jgi:hypothetical protein
LGLRGNPWAIAEAFEGTRPVAAIAQPQVFQSENSDAFGRPFAQLVCARAVVNV